MLFIDAFNATSCIYRAGGAFRFLLVCPVLAKERNTVDPDILPY